MCVCLRWLLHGTNNYQEYERSVLYNSHKISSCQWSPAKEGNMPHVTSADWAIHVGLISAAARIT